MDGQYYNFPKPKIKKPHYLGGLKLYPVCFDDKNFSKDIKLLDDLLDKKEIEAYEVSEQGTVENIGLKNLSVFHTLIIDGEAVIGAKQNRIAQTTIILSPKSETIIPVNCVEKGRWSYSQDRSFKRSEFSISPKMRDRKADLIKKRQSLKIDKLKPGITGYAQINGRDNISINEKIKIDHFYLKNKSIKLDFKIIFLTLYKIINLKNISH